MHRETLSDVSEIGDFMIDSSLRPNSVTLEFDIEPLAVQSVRRGRFGFYSPPKVKAWKEAIAEKAREQFPWDPYSGPIGLSYIQYRFAYPKTLTKSIRNRIESGEVFHMDRRSDLMDNLNKATMDALSGILFNDDCQVVQFDGLLEKIYSTTPGITMTFHNLEGKVNVLPKK